MSESVNLPALGESVTEGTVTRWLKNVGDRVEVDEPLLEVSTDKVDTEIPSPVAGVIEEILVAEDETVEVGTALVRIGDGSASQSPADEPEAAAEPEQAPSAPAEPEAEEPELPSSAAPAPGEDSAASAPEPAPAVDPAPAAQQDGAQQDAAGQQPAAAQPQAARPSSEQPAPSAPTPSPATGSSETSAPATPAPSSGAPVGYVTPLVRKLANEKGVDISTLSGSGVGGRIRKEDVLAAAEAAATSTTSEPASSGPAPIEVSPLRGTTVPMSRLRKVVAERAVQSMQAMAQLTSVVEVDVTKVAAFRDANKGAFLEKTGNKLSFLPFFTLAAAEALKAHPKLNATVDGDSIVYPDHEHVAMAVDTERGLLTPVIKNASDLDLAGIAGQIADLAQRTRDNKLKPDELAGGTFTVTNTGSRGALFDTPVVFLPQVAILGTGIVVKRPVVIKADGSESIAIRSMVYLALSYDHRIVDGADAARFLVAVKERLEGGDFTSKLGI
ncbi:MULTISPECIES: 2-oxoglutarate dehydrogenase, E2 component, dihydrolipoamide succinyltransferase [unclassified Frigoribacterium]|uniref:2-oxoglutarate dehydrogenase, E2 component, dihydrolipoamide succinyltransferase n=1 Tax=unclassified Frigoribacterium TaxID=2627005 RepID=UPI0015649F01|nr:MULTISPECIES: 2-oxoglutarate dehydrogenase, E2 component, dihydrolipoamide succinyltransferase [unclassified Frigoribacterium]NQW86060.1 2-oxoglutarate dehydrogenase, E2 component, dihydrolipoamide succinyltransferase [Frigoribacterium sp. VKM Ac-2860]NQX07392.1 2-oxoglutarate dehydrogenase, E2 component, dihydrolipoamide succinyltransferase [Frigoribacterium sp. VKM Ac-2859]